MTNKELYIELCENQPTIPIFSQPWWLDCVAGQNNWDVALVSEKNKIKASMPYVQTTKMGMTILNMPKLTQTLGPWIAPNTLNEYKRLSLEKKLLTELISQLPNFSQYQQNWHHSRTNWLPFYWHGFEQSTNYTYVLSDLKDLAVLFKSFASNVKGDIKKAENRFKLEVKVNPDLEEFIELNKMVFKRQGKALPYTEDFVRQLDKVCTERKCRRIFIAKDEQGRNHAGVYIIWDRNSAYYIMGGGDPEMRNSGATSLCMWNAIQFASQVTQKFDFEGSMLEPVERFFRAFGAKQTPYFSVKKTNSKSLLIQQFLSKFKS